MIKRSRGRDLKPAAGAKPPSVPYDYCDPTHSHKPKALTVSGEDFKAEGYKDATATFNPSAGNPFPGHQYDIPDLAPNK